MERVKDAILHAIHFIDNESCCVVDEPLRKEYIETSDALREALEIIYKKEGK